MNTKQWDKDIKKSYENCLEAFENCLEQTRVWREENPEKAKESIRHRTVSELLKETEK